MLVGLSDQLARIMESVFEAYLGPDSVLASAVGQAVGSGEPEDIPRRNTDVWVLGKKYNAIQGKMRPSLMLSYGYKSSILARMSHKGFPKLFFDYHRWIPNCNP